MISAQAGTENKNAQDQQDEQASDVPALPAETLSTIMKIMPIISSINKEDKNTKFLSALRPLLSDKRQAKLDESVKMMQMIKVLPLLKGQGIL